MNNIKEALEKFNSILCALITAKGDTNPRVGTAHHNIGVAHLRSGNLHEALNSIKKAIKIRKMTLGGRDPKVSDSLVEFGIILLSKNDYHESLKTFRTALKIREIERSTVTSNSRKPIDLQIAKILSNIGCVFFESGNMKHAESMFKRAVLLHQTYTTKDPGLLAKASNMRKCSLTTNENFESGGLAMISAMCNLGYVYLRKSKWKLAVTQLEKTVKLQRTLLKPGNRFITNTIETLIYAYTKDNAHKKAIKECNSLLLSQQSLLGKNHISTTGTMRRLVYCHVKLYEYNEAYKILHDIERIQTEQLGEDSFDLEETKKYIISVNYNILKFPTFHEIFGRCGLVDKSLIDEDDNELFPCIPDSPQFSSKLSGHKVSYA